MDLKDSQDPVDPTALKRIRYSLDLKDRLDPTFPRDILTSNPMDTRGMAEMAALMV